MLPARQSRAKALRLFDELQRKLGEQSHASVQAACGPCEGLVVHEYQQAFSLNLTTLK